MKVKFYDIMKQKRTNQRRSIFKTYGASTIDVSQVLKEIKELNNPCNEFYYSIRIRG